MFDNNQRKQVAKLAINKSLLKEYSNSEYSRIVYMKDNSEFQIQLFNPNSYTYGAEIFINGTSLNNKVIVRPGERVWIERFFDSPNKFKFNTYEVSNSKEAKKAIEYNGEIMIKFYKEKVQASNINTISVSTGPFNTFGDYYIYDKELTFYDKNLVPTAPKVYYSNSISVPQEVGTQNCLRSITSASIVPKDYSHKTSIDTGRVEKGSHSNQGIKNMNIDLEYWAFDTIKIKILPESCKPISKNDLQKQYCTNCGRKLKDKFKFCPYCGAKIEECHCENGNKNYEIYKCPHCQRNVRSNMLECPHCGEILG